MNLLLFGKSPRVMISTLKKEDDVLEDRSYPTETEKASGRSSPPTRKPPIRIEHDSKGEGLPQ